MHTWEKPIYFDGERLDVVVESASGFSERKLNRFLGATEKLMEILNSLDFKIALTSLGQDELTETKGKTSREVYEHIMTGQDLYDSDGPDYEFEIRINAYYRRFSRTVGYTFRSTRATWFNLKFWYSDSYLIGNIAHETMHNMGYDHLIRGRHLTSAPYVVGNICARLARKNHLTPLSETMLKKIKKRIDQV